MVPEESHEDIIAFVYSDNGTFFFQKLYQEAERIRKMGLPLEGSHFIRELDMTLLDALNLAVTATSAIQDEFIGKDHHGDFEAWKKKHPEETMDYQTWITKTLVYQLDELKLTDVNDILKNMDVQRLANAPGAGQKGKKKKKRFFGRR